MLLAVGHYVSLAYFTVVQLIIALGVPYPPDGVATGMDSFVERPSIQVAYNVLDWDALWQKHKGITPIGNANGVGFPSAEKPPSVNFDKEEVLVIFGGLAANGGYQVVDSMQMSNRVQVRIKPLPMLGQTGAAGNSEFKANPYAFIMFPRIKLPIEVQIPGKDANGNPAWQTVAYVGGLEDKSQ